MGFLIDTSALVQIERDRRELHDTLRGLGEQEAALAAITASELLHGVHRADSSVRRGRRSAFVEAVLSILPILPFDLSVARVHAEIWADVRKRGFTVGAHDLLIAATALHHDLTILTGNERDFLRVPDLKVRSWGDGGSFSR